MVFTVLNLPVPEQPCSATLLVATELLILSLLQLRITTSRKTLAAEESLMWDLAYLSLISNNIMDF